MAGPTASHDSLSVEEYLKLEEGATVRHEYVGGEIFAMVACGPEGDDPLVEDDPCLVVEVASPGTETTDRREKLAAYKRMPGLRAYLIVAQNRKWVERHFRGEDGAWHRGDLVDEGRFPVPCPGTTLTLAEIYEGLE